MLHYVGIWDPKFIVLSVSYNLSWLLVIRNLVVSFSKIESFFRSRKHDGYSSPGSVCMSWRDENFVFEKFQISRVIAFEFEIQ